jgi:hypothetical protein
VRGLIGAIALVGVFLFLAIFWWQLHVRIARHRAEALRLTVAVRQVGPEQKLIIDTSKPGAPAPTEYIISPDGQREKQTADDYAWAAAKVEQAGAALLLVLCISALARFGAPRLRARRAR